MIVKDEARMIERCLESARAVADQLVVVDTGSSDATPQLATRAGAEVYHHPWRGDFSEARNHSLSYARGAWVLILDGDERHLRLSRAKREVTQMRKRMAEHDSAHMRAARGHFLVPVRARDDQNHRFGKLRAVLRRESVDALERPDGVALNDAIPSRRSGDLSAHSQ